MEGEVREKPAPSGSMGKKRVEEINKETVPIHMHTLFVTKLVQISEQWNFRNTVPPLPQTQQEGGVGAGAGTQ